MSRCFNIIEKDLFPGDRADESQAEWDEHANCSLVLECNKQSDLYMGVMAPITRSDRFSLVSFSLWISISCISWIESLIRIED